jgi:hypothetical protein
VKVEAYLTTPGTSTDSVHSSTSNNTCQIPDKPYMINKNIEKSIAGPIFGGRSVVVGAIPSGFP